MGEGGPESAKVLKDAMQKAGEEAAKDAKGAEKLEDLEALGSLEGGEKVLGSSDECRSKDPAHCPVHGTPETKETGKSDGHANASPRKPTVGSKNPDTPEVQAEQLAKAKAAFAKCLESHEDQMEAFSRGDIGLISLLYGQAEDTPEGRAWGLAHFAKRKDTVEHLPETLILGEAGEPYQDGQKRNITWGKYTAVIALKNGPKKPPRPERWVLTAFQPSEWQNEGGQR